MKLNSGVECSYNNSDRYFGALLYKDDYSADSYLSLRSVTLSDIEFSDGTASLVFDPVSTNTDMDVRVCNDDITLL